MAQSIPRLLFVGAGNIAQSIMKGIISAQPNAANQILVTAPTNRNLDIIKETLGCQTSLLNNILETLPRFKPDMVLVCVKPQVLMASIYKRDPLTELLRSIPHRCTTLSLLAGIKSQVFASAFNLPERNIVRVMLNTSVELRSSSIFYYAHGQVQSETLNSVEQLFKPIGQPVVRLHDENLMDVATGVCGSGIAFFYEAIQAISDISVRNGLTRADSIKMAAQLSKSAGEMLLAKQEHPYQLRDNVASPAGTTIYGLQKWHELSTNQKIGQSVQAAVDRAKQLSEMSESRLDHQLSDNLCGDNN